ARRRRRSAHRQELLCRFHASRLTHPPRTRTARISHRPKQRASPQHPPQPLERSQLTMTINWSKIESIFADIFKIGTEIAAVAAPIVDIAAPGIGAVYNLSVNAAMQAEEAADEAASKETTNAAKLVAITAAVQPYLIAAAQQAGVSSPTTAQINAYAQSVLDGLEILSVSSTPVTTT